MGRSRRLVLAALAALPVLALAACGTGGGGGTTPDVPPLRLVQILPTPNGLTDAVPGHRAGAPEVQEALVGHPDAAVAKQLDDVGLGEAATRSWRGPGDRSLVVVVARYPDHDTALSIGADAAEELLNRGSSSAWTPRQIGGSRGARAGSGADAAAALSFAVGDVSLFARSEGGVPDDVVETAVARLATALGAQPK
ncbi:MAG TPA: hypothetical protein VKD47_10810 [Miltoncostaeaceae bacterium]|nr:hypothetical protein [Miltoncostaeaceae bacterium]